MSRPIKFRAWDKAGDCWLQSALIQDFLSIGVPWTEKNEDGSFKLHQVSENRIEIMQYTGLKDKNGVEIYEGDVVRVDGHNYKVVWGYQQCSFYLGIINTVSALQMYKALSGEVIGNIMENPELLK